MLYVLWQCEGKHLKIVLKGANPERFEFRYKILLEVVHEPRYTLYNFENILFGDSFLIKSYIILIIQKNNLEQPRIKPVTPSLTCFVSTYYNDIMHEFIILYYEQ